MTYKKVSQAVSHEYCYRQEQMLLQKVTDGSSYKKFCLLWEG